MLERYFAAPKMIAHLRAGPSGPYIDGFARRLEDHGYDHSVAMRYLRAAAHIGHFTLEQGGTLANMDLIAFSRHLRTCRCPRPKGGRRKHHTVFGSRRYQEYLAAIGIGQGARPQKLTILIRRSSPSIGDGCGNIGVQRNRLSDFIPETPPTC
jgi:hypothetical protein